MMRSDEDRIAQLLHEVAADMPADPELERRTLRRSRRHRALNATLAGAVATVLIAGSFAGLRAVTPDRTLPGGGNTPTTSPDPSGSTRPSPPAGLPDRVAATWSTIMAGVEERDFEALASVLDPMVFQYNAGDGSDPIPEWRQDPSILDAIPTVLSLDYVVRDFGDDYGTVYLWPYLVDADMSAPTEQERADLHALGFSDRDIEMMSEGAIGDGEPLYLGPRVSIRADGVWTAYVTGGD